MIIIAMIILAALVSLFVFINLSRSIAKINNQLLEFEETAQANRDEIEEKVVEKITEFKDGLAADNEKHAKDMKSSVVALTIKNANLPVEDAIRLLQYVEEDWFDSKFVSHKNESDALKEFIEENFTEENI